MTFISQIIIVFTIFKANNEPENIFNKMAKNIVYPN